MDWLYQWIQNIVYYLLFVTVLMNLLPSGKYEKYLRLFAGCILILLVLQPLTGGLRLEDKIAGIFEKISFQNEAGELTREILDMENKRMEALVRRYEEETEKDIAKMAALEGEAVSVDIDADPESPSFGSVTHVLILLDSQNNPDSRGKRGMENLESGKLTDIGQEAGSDQAAAKKSRGDTEDTAGKVSAGSVEQVKPVKVGIHIDTEERGTGEGRAQIEAAAYPEEWIKLKEKIAGYYQVEEQYVEIRIENE